MMPNWVEAALHAFTTAGGSSPRPQSFFAKFLVASSSHVQGGAFPLTGFWELAWQRPSLSSTWAHRLEQPRLHNNTPEKGHTNFGSQAVPHYRFEFHLLMQSNTCSRSVILKVVVWAFGFCSVL